jgi:hypothetical protein
MGRKTSFRPTALLDDLNHGVGRARAAPCRPPFKKVFVMSVTSIIDGTVFKVVEGGRSEEGVIEVFEGDGRVDQKRVS